MRILGYIEHPELKITVFKNDERISVKLENAGYEQTFKFGKDERVATLESVKQLIDAEFLQTATAHMRLLHENKAAAYKRMFTDNTEEVFETIL